MAREFDAVIFGASGFTGQFLVEEMAISVTMEELYKRDNIRWAVAGRNKEKVAKVLENTAKLTQLDWCTKVPIIEADIKDYNSILEMCKRTKMILNTVGPYQLYGEPVVKACVEAATNYCDVSGEPYFLEEMQLKYHEEAKKKNIYIVSAAGWDSVPADLGTSWTKKQVDCNLNGVEIFVIGEGSQTKGSVLNFGTMYSAIQGVANMSKLGPLRRKLYKEIPAMMPPPSKPTYKMPKRGLLSRVEEIKGYCLPFLGSDKSVVQRSEIFKYNQYKEAPVQVETYFKVGSIKSGIQVIMGMSMFGLLAKFSFGRYLLERFPGFFSFGYCSKEGVPRETLEARRFKHIIIGYGFDGPKLSDPDMQHTSEPKKKIITMVSGGDPGYIFTSRFIVHSAMTIHFDHEIINSPGVITPGAAFANTYLVDRLSKRGIKFEVLERF